MHVTISEWAIVLGLLAVTIGGGLWAVRRSSLPAEQRDQVTAFLWAYAAVYCLIFAAGYLYFGGMVLGIHWLIGAVIAGLAARSKVRKKNSDTA